MEQIVNEFANFLRNIRPVWIGLKIFEDGSTWMFTDGTAPPSGSASLDSTNTGNCVGIHRSQNMGTVPCHIPRKYMCMTKGKIV